MKVFLATVFKTYSEYPITYYSSSFDTLTSFLKETYPRLDLNDVYDVIVGYKDIPDKELKNYIFIENL